MNMMNKLGLLALLLCAFQPVQASKGDTTKKVASVLALGTGIAATIVYTTNEKVHNSTNKLLLDTLDFAKKAKNNLLKHLPEVDYKSNQTLSLKTEFGEAKGQSKMEFTAKGKKGEYSLFCGFGFSSNPTNQPHSKQETNNTITASLENNSTP